MNRPGFVAIALALFLPSPMLAGPARLAEEVVVTATGHETPADETGSAVTVIGREEIERSRARFAVDLLRAVPGVLVHSYGSPGQLATLQLRGAEARQVLVLIDGVRVDDPYFGAYDWTHLPAASIERIEIARGPYSALWGTDAIGGVVQLFTRRGEERPAVSVSAGAGNRGQRLGRVSAAAGLGGVQFSVDGSIRRYDGFRENEDFDNRLGAVRAELPWDGGSVGAEVRSIRSEYGIPTNGVTAALRRRGEVDEDVFAVPVKAVLGGGFSAEAQLSRFDRSYRFSDPDDPFGFTSSRTDSTSDSARTVLRWGNETTTVSAGFHYLSDEATDVSNFGVSIDDGKTVNRAFFLQDELRLPGGFSLVAGVRRDEHSAFGATTHPRGSLAWHSADGRVLASMSAGSAFRAPSVGELHYPFSGNPALRPERSRSAEAGIEVRPDGATRAGVRAFWSRGTDQIDFDFATYTFANLGRTRTRGLEVELERSIVGGFSAGVSATWLDAEQCKADRESCDGDPSAWSRLPRRAARSASGRLAWTAGEASADLRASWVGRRPDVPGSPELPSYLRVDLGGTVPVFSGLGVFVRAENLLDRDYEEIGGYPAPGRLVVGGIEWTLR